ncbi:hypothetical protein EGM97_03690 [Pseudomonas sp. AF32]|nr:hypothetical protein [Pseudomonas sp. AF32]
MVGAPQIDCGSGLARECAVAVCIIVTDTPLSRASPLPHWFWGVFPASYHTAPNGRFFCSVGRAY